jgi:hypothetical protein
MRILGAARTSWRYLWRSRRIYTCSKVQAVEMAMAMNRFFSLAAERIGGGRCGSVLLCVGCPYTVFVILIPVIASHSAETVASLSMGDDLGALPRGTLNAGERLLRARMEEAVCSLPQYLNSNTIFRSVRNCKTTD